MAGAMDFCEYVKSKGYGIYVLSNACNGFYKYFPNFAELSYFDGVMVSSDVHMIKPEEGIYTHFSSADSRSETDIAYTLEQYRCFETPQINMLNDLLAPFDLKSALWRSIFCRMSQS